MINKLTIVLILLFSIQNLYSQIILKVEGNTNEKLEKEINPDGVRRIVLKNGLTVYLKEDHTQKDILGAVVVRGGAKLDAADATGTAHYFEHMMFKGSTTLGTSDYKQEKVYLDSIREQYELLRLDKDNQEFRTAILKHIDKLSVKAAQYAIPNEFSNVMASIGATGVNAYTTYENIVYHNSFPKQSIEQWVELYVDRFENPIFRLFQSELETVYEEKNRSMDNYFRIIFEEVYKNFYPKSIYGKKTVLGSVEDLKNPSIMAMESYFKAYYNANNMALVLIGDFETANIIELLKSKFGQIRDGQKANIPSATEDAFDGRVVVKKKLSPIALGILGYRTVPIADEDELAIDVVAKLLTNDDETGLIDKLSKDQKLLGAQVFQDKHYDKSGFFIFYAPKPIIQSVSKGEKLVIEQLEKLKSGDFDDELLSAVKMSILRQEVLDMENSSQVLSDIIDDYMSENKPSKKETLSKIDIIDKSEIIRIANKYFGDNYLAFHSKMGFSKKKPMEKPNNTPLKFEEDVPQSKMAERIANMPYSEIEPNYIDFKRDVVTTNIKENLHLYHVNNPLNNIFSINFRVAMGEMQEPRVAQLAFYLNNTGVDELSNSEFNRKLQLYGSSVSFYTSRDYFTISVYGFNNKLKQTLIDLNHFLLNFSENDKLTKKLVRENKMELKMIKKDINYKINILNEYALYGDQSQYLNNLTKKEIKSLKYSDYKELMTKVLSKQTYIHYVGGKSVEAVSSIIAKQISFSEKLQRGNSPYLRDLTTYTKDRVYFLADKNAIQSHIRLVIPANKLDKYGRGFLKPYNYYFGIGMNSIIFKEIREYRSLAYSAYAYYTVPYKFDRQGYFNAAMSTQADKTNESIELMESLIDEMPLRKNQIKTLRSFLARSFNSDIPSFRTRSYIVQYWRQQGYTSDPRAEVYNVYRKIELDQIRDFHEYNVKGKVSTISIIGDSKQFDLDKIKKGKQFKELKLKDIYRY